METAKRKVKEIQKQLSKVAELVAEIPDAALRTRIAEELVEVISATGELRAGLSMVGSHKEEGQP